MAIRMQSKYDKYWDLERINPLLIVAVILDPRYKVTYVEIAFDNLFPDVSKRDATLKKVINVLRRMYDEYALNIRPNHESESHPPKEKEDIGRNSVAIPDDISLSDVDPTFMKFLATASTMCQKVEKLSEID